MNVKIFLVQRFRFWMSSKWWTQTSSNKLNINSTNQNFSYFRILQIIRSQNQQNAYFSKFGIKMKLHTPAKLLETFLKHDKTEVWDLKKHFNREIGYFKDFETMKTILNYHKKISMKTTRRSRIFGFQSAKKWKIKKINIS